MIQRALVFSSTVIVSLFLGATFSYAAPQSCHELAAGSALTNGFGAPYDVLSSAQTLLLTAECDTTTNTVTAQTGSGSNLQYIYELGYRWGGTQWQQITHTIGSRAGTGVPWFVGSARANFTVSPQELTDGGFYVAYICSWTGSQWKCGCSDQLCATPKWQLQRFKLAQGGSSSGGSGSSSGTGSSGGSGPIGNWPTFDDMNIDDYTNGGVAREVPPGDPGSFRTECAFSHFNYDDPIVFPGVKSATHLHMFFGNTLADYTSTVHSIENSGDGTCQGGPLNRTAYWVPALIDRNNNARIPQSMLIYYKNGDLPEGTIEKLPSGLKIVVGNAKATSPQPDVPFDQFSAQNAVEYEWYCGSLANWQTLNAHSHTRSIPDCPKGHFISLKLRFPQCWDGRLDSPNHRDHVAYPRYSYSKGAYECPSTHPRHLPQITYNIYYNNNDTNTAGWYLSSDKHGSHNAGAGVTTHGDWMGGWHPTISDTFIRECTNNASVDCKEGTISATKELNRVEAKYDNDFYNPNKAPKMKPVSQIPQ